VPDAGDSKSTGLCRRTVAASRHRTKFCHIHAAAKSMRHLRDFTWWPNAWFDEASRSLSSSEIRKDGVLKLVRCFTNRLTLVVDYNGVFYRAEIYANRSDDFLIRILHILLQHQGEPMEMVENIEIDFDHLT